MPRTLTNIQRYPLVPYSRKSANSAYGGDGAGETSFESAFADMAHAHLRSRAPMLLDYELGFQLLDKDEDNRRAQGVFGFKVGDTLLLAPSFFDRGEIKGYELLNIQDSDTYVPLKENWVNYLLGRKPMVIGRPVGDSRRFNSSWGADLRPYRESPLKYASEKGSGSWFEASLPSMAWAMSKEGLESTLHSLNSTSMTMSLVKESSEAAVLLCNAVNARPKWAKVLDQNFPGLLQTAYESASKYGTLVENRLPRRQKRAAVDIRKVVSDSLGLDPTSTIRISRVTVRVFGDKSTGFDTTGLTESQMEELFEGGIAVDDTREEKDISQVIPERSTVQLFPPLCTGVFRTLLSDGLRDMLVIPHPQGALYRSPGTLIVDPDSKKWRLVPQSDLLVKEPHTPDDEDSTPKTTYKELWSGLSEAKSLERGEKYILLGESGDCLGPFTVGPSRPTASGSSAFVGYFDGDDSGVNHRISEPESYTQFARSNIVDKDRERSTSPVVWIGVDKSKTLQVPKNGTRDIYVPSSFKALKLDYDCGCSGDPTLAPGRIQDIELGIRENTDPLTVKRAHDRSYLVNGRQLPDWRYAVKTLIEEHGLCQKQAKEVLALTGNGTGRFRVKRAQGFRFPDDMEETNYSQEFGDVPTRESRSWSEDMTPQRPMRHRRDPRHIRPTSEMMNSIGDAVQSGQREIMDASMVSNLIKQNQEDSVIDQHLGSLARTLDSYGRLLVGLYSKPHLFEERYGEKELRRMEDSFRTNFLAIGDDLLFLRQNHVDPFNLKDQDVDVSDQGF